MEKNNFYTTILVNQSIIDTIRGGAYYSTLKKGKKFFIFDDAGRRTILDETKIQWQLLDPTVMLVKINSSLLDTVYKDKIYRVFDDIKNDERYIIDENGVKVLFDRMLFNYEIL
jgi:hypothetical protein